MRAWQFSSVAGGLEKNLFQPAAGAPKPCINDEQILVEVYSMALNPADYKVPELGLIMKMVLPSPSTPGADFCGRVAEIGKKVEGYRVDEMVFGVCDSKTGIGSLGQYIVVDKRMLTSKPKEIGVDDAASIGIAGLTAYQSIKPNIKEGDKVFINGGSGGTGVWGIQIAKTLGCHVTTSCSAGNVKLCRDLGADEVIDYKAVDIVDALKEQGPVFNLVVDNVGSPSNLYHSSNVFLKPGGKFVQVGIGPGLGSMKQLSSNMLWPGFLGGGKHKYELLLMKPKAEDLKQLAEWAKEGKIRAVIDTLFEFDDAPKAFEKLKTGRTKGKIVVHVRQE